MKKYEEHLTPDAVLLNKYLNQYKHCIGRKKALEHRRNEISREFSNPLSGISYDGMPHGSGEGVGCAAISFRLDEIDTRIKEQIDKSVKLLDEIMDVIGFLPENSIERTIIEHRYIDRMNWDKICRIENISRTPGNRYWRKGLYQLLEFKKVQQIIHDFEKQQEAAD